MAAPTAMAAPRSKVQGTAMSAPTAAKEGTAAKEASTEGTGKQKTTALNAERSRHLFKGLYFGVVFWGHTDN